MAWIPSRAGNDWRGDASERRQRGASNVTDGPGEQTLQEPGVGSAEAGRVSKLLFNGIHYTRTEMHLATSSDLPPGLEKRRAGPLSTIMATLQNSRHPPYHRETGHTGRNSMAIEFPRPHRSESDRTPPNPPAHPHKSAAVVPDGPKAHRIGTSSESRRSSPGTSPLRP